MSKSIFAVVPAAGIGLRMGTDVPKQYLKINGQPIIAHTLNRICSNPSINTVIVAIREDDLNWHKIAPELATNIMTAQGGNERFESVLSALNLLPQEHDEDWVLVHDVVRPCVSDDDIDGLIDYVFGLDEENREHGAILGIPCRDTMKQIGNNEIHQTLDRSKLWHALTPQMFTIGKLRQALTNARDVGVGVTDEAQAMERMGYRPHMVEGSPRNIKVTYDHDLTIASVFLRELEDED